ncbi:MAG TPA: tetratricopeptide repeat protein [Syntrophales bacterium]|nr:tetratricopeptide repeat protein [Syntrophales bacterium]
MSLFGEIRRIAKEADRIELYRFLLIWAVVFGVFLTVEVYTGYVPAWFLVVIPPVMAAVVMGIVAGAGDKISRTFRGGPKAAWSAGERSAGDLEKIRFSKRQGRFDEALFLINEFLKQFPKHPEALFLKAQILHEGFGHDESARKCLRAVLTEVPASEPLHRWADRYHEDITGAGLKEKDPSA